MDVFEPAQLGALRLRNRIFKAATYEGMSPGGVASPKLESLHRDVARGGTALTTVAYCAVSPDGRTFADQLFLRPESLAPLRALTTTVHAEGGLAGLQLAHAGFFSKLRRSDGSPPRGPSATFNAYGTGAGLPWAGAMTIADIRAVIQAFADSARVARDLGFDALELHLGHGYLLSQFLSPATNRRTDDYGGNLRNRARLPLEVVRAVRDAVGSDVALLAKINLDDGFKGGATVEDAVELSRALEHQGALDALVLSGGFTSRSAFYLLRGGLPLGELAAAQKTALERISMRVAGPFLVKPYPFTPRFFAPLARQIRDAVQMPLVALGGHLTRDDLRDARDDGFDFIALGRALIADPDLPERMSAGEMERSRCVSCNRCIPQADLGGVRCVL